MATIRPFAGYRPQVEYAKDVAALPYDVYSREEAKVEIEDKPLSFLRVDRAETTLDDSVGTYDDIVYERAKENLERLIADDIYVEEEKPVFYLYELTRDGHVQTGLVATCAVDEYLNHKIKRHELTRPEKEKDRIKHIDTLDMDTGPIFLTYRNDKDISHLVDEIKESAPLYDFLSDDGIRHRVFRIDDEATIEDLVQKFETVDTLYIADGHHRCASTVKVAEKRREEDDNPTGDKPYDYFLAVIFPDNELEILDYNRVVEDLGGLDKDTFLSRLEDLYTITSESGPVRPEKKGEFGMYLDDQWYKLDYREKIPKDPVLGLDVSILNDTILQPLLGIEDLTTDSRVDFIGGVRGLGELERRVRDDMRVAFSLYPTSIGELIQIADLDLLMPPKSTWFEPKLRSGLFIYKLS